MNKIYYPYIGIQSSNNDFNNLINSMECNENNKEKIMHKFTYFKYKKENNEMHLKKLFNNVLYSQNISNEKKIFILDILSDVINHT